VDRGVQEQQRAGLAVAQTVARTMAVQILAGVVAVELAKLLVMAAQAFVLSEL
jgi:hypothetical protein